MARHVFFSFHFDNDYWRTQQVRNMGAIEGQSLCTPNAWEEVKRKGAAAVENWINDNLWGKTCVIVLVGSQTAQRPWVRKEIVKGWDANKGVLAIRVHRLLDTDSRSSVAGENPLAKVTHGPTGKLLSSLAPIYDPSGSDSKAVYANIRDNMEKWIEAAIAIRKVN